MGLLQEKLAKYDLPQKFMAQGVYPYFREIEGKQGTEVEMGGHEVLMFGSNAYTGLTGDERVIEAGIQAMHKYGSGCAGSRFLNGTLDLHVQLEKELAAFVGKDEALCFSTGFTVNSGVIPALTDRNDYIICDDRDHASIVDGRRLSFSQQLKYKHNDMADLEKQLQKCNPDSVKLIIVDGVFSMDGYIANLKGICDLADEYDAMVMVDDSHAVGFMGEHGRGTAEYCGVMGRVDIITGTFGKAMGGASGGYTASKKEVVDLLRQRSRPYLFSNTLAPAICAATIETINMLEESTALRDKVHENAAYFRKEMEKIGFDLLPGEHPIVPVMLYDPKVANEFARRMLDKGVYVVGFCYPVVPKGRDRVRTQISAGHTKEDLDFAVKCFAEVKAEMGI